MDTLLDKLAADQVSGPWDGPSPRAWRDRITRAVVRAVPRKREVPPPHTARRRHRAALAGRCVRTWGNGDGTGTFCATGPADDIGRIDDILGRLADQQPTVGPDGSRVRMDHRRYQALVELFDAVAAGQPLPSVPVRREREVGLVLHADTLFGDDEHKDEPGQQRGLGAPVVLDPDTARDLARAQLAAGRAAALLLVGADGILDRLVRLGAQPAGGWTRQTLAEALLKKLPHLPPLRVDGYTPTAAMGEQVRAVWPTCAGYDCPRTARRCDLDHEDPWPRGPTSVTNLTPKCRRHHQRKTLGLWHSQRQADGAVTWTTLLGTTVTVQPEPLPGC